jgi:hypothetical protein
MYRNRTYRPGASNQEILGGGLQNIVNIIRDINPRVGAEVGVYRGDTSRLLLETFPGLFLYLVDTWAGDSVGDNIFSGKSAYYDTIKNVEEYRDRVHILHTQSVLAAGAVPDGLLDFVFIDADHEYESVRDDIEAWFPKVRLGGLITGHDYNQMRFPGVVQAVNERFGNIEIHNDGRDYAKNGNLSIWVHKK